MSLYWSREKISCFNFKHLTFVPSFIMAIVAEHDDRSPLQNVKIYVRKLYFVCDFSYKLSRWWKSLQDWFKHWLKRRHDRSTGIEVSFLSWFYLVKPFYWQCPKHAKNYDKLIMINIINNYLWKTAMIFILHKTTWYVCTSRNSVQEIYSGDFLWTLFLTKRSSLKSSE